MTPGPWLLGDQFSAADVALGAVMSVALFDQRIPEIPAIAAYNDRLSQRPAYQRAAEANWPPAQA